MSLALEKERLRKKWLLSPLNDRQRDMLERLLAGYDEKLTSSSWARITGASQDSAGRDINDLVARGILSRDSAGGRSTSYRLAVAPNGQKT